MKYFYSKKTSDCNLVYGCFRSPKDCVDSACKYLIKWRNLGDSTEFVLSTNQNLKDEQYISIGLSFDTEMGNDWVVICKFFKNDSFSIENYFNTDEKRPEKLNKNSPSEGLENFQINKNDKILSCSFRRRNDMPAVEKYFNTLNNTYHLQH